MKTVDAIAELRDPSRRLAHEWSAARHALGGASWSWLVIAVVAAVAAMTVMAVGWHRVLDALGARVAVADAVVWYYVGEIGKYLPGTVWPVVGLQLGVPAIPETVRPRPGELCSGRGAAKQGVARPWPLTP